MNPANEQLSPAEKTWQTHETLNELYGVLDLRKPRREPIHELISTMLSHRTTHANEETAYYRMRELFPTWPEVMVAPLEELTQALQTAQYPGPKAINIQKTLRLIQEKAPDFSLHFLEEMSVDEAMKWLMDLPGVGLKTATLLLLFNFHKPVLPVDTHVFRVSQRIGLIGAKVSAEKAHTILLDMLPKEAPLLFNFHKHLYWHGQRICTWKGPKCEECPVCPICNYCQEVRQKGIDKKARNS
ncbi:endonuclease III domain-containing protein [Adhaeribacter pallidiroseus]|uniref:DNA-(Apurinic or apyrimidinic site) lyase n=1 Tax=Adhaeribacter pallidiroseus TaxID=2072847 RepID=A0A369QF20_9BACT|nr:endonuclease III [Adhaeribacter pallidiroseus]RDC62165.1 DNA-(apurinic or apyrimidinic site) lyase [Adhaeribacter pallidiroseus]